MDKIPARSSPAPESNDRRTLLLALIMVASLFFIWGFCHAMLDVLNKHFQNILQVSKTQSGFVQTSVFGAYFLMALPSALLIRRIGYQKGILLGLLVVAIGAFLFVPAGLWFKTFEAFLVALFVLSSGVAYIIAPTVGGALIFGKRHEAGTPVDFRGLLIPYVVLGCVVLVVFGVFWFIKLPSLEGGSESK